MFQLDQRLDVPRGMQRGQHDDDVGRIRTMQSDSGLFSKVLSSR